MSAAETGTPGRERAFEPEDGRGREQGQVRRLRTVVLSSLLGTTVEWYDFFLYSTAAGLVFGKLFFPTSDGTVGAMLAFAALARASSVRAEPVDLRLVLAVDASGSTG